MPAVGDAGHLRLQLRAEAVALAGDGQRPLPLVTRHARGGERPRRERAYQLQATRCKVKGASYTSYTLPVDWRERADGFPAPRQLVRQPLPLREPARL